MDIISANLQIKYRVRSLESLGVNLTRTKPKRNFNFLKKIFPKKNKVTTMYSEPMRMQAAALVNVSTDITVTVATRITSNCLSVVTKGSYKGVP